MPRLLALRRASADNSAPSWQEEWVSLANSRQRQGRAGRVRAGHYYALFTQQRAATLRCVHRRNLFIVCTRDAETCLHACPYRPFPQPEMLRVSMTETALQIKQLDLGPVEVVLSRAPDPPAPEAVREAVEALTEAGALDAAGELTPLGHHLARLPVDVRAGKIIVLGAVLGALRPALTIAAYLSSKSPFLAPYDERDAADGVRRALAAPGAKGIAAGQRSDHLVVVAAYDGWLTACASGGARAGAEFCRRYYLCPNTLSALTGTSCCVCSALQRSTEPRASQRLAIWQQICAASLHSCWRRLAFWGEVLVRPF